MDDSSNPTFLISVPYQVPPHSTETRFGYWVCMVSQTPNSDLDFTVQCSQEQPFDKNCRYSRLRIYAATTCDPASLCLEMPIRTSDVLLQGLRAQIDPAMVRSYDRYIFRVILFRDRVEASSSGLKQRQGLRDSNVSAQTELQCVRSSLHSSQVSSKARFRLTEFLERAINADVQLSFSPRAGFGFRVAEDNSRGFEQPRVLHAHSCILKTVESPAMTRLLNIPSPVGNNERYTGNDHHDTRTVDEGSSSSKVREIRFEDSPPAAVDAVVRYIYLGQKPAIEPFCGYTVKDLMLLSTYLEIVCLQNHCVDLVLGRFQDLDGDESPPALLCDGASDLSWTAHDRRPCHVLGSRVSRWRGPLSSVSADSLVQVLFDWGYRFQKIRCCIVRALVLDHGYMFADPVAMGMWLDRFCDHEAFGAILYQLVEEQLAMDHNNRTPFS
ncbi:unnamed protein product [Mortierella alpina]